MSENSSATSFIESFSKIGESFFSLEAARKAAEWYINTNERLANQGIELQQKITEWAKETPLAAFFDAQHAIARKLVERSAAAARNLWQIPQPSASAQ
jgi:hypothetical protein